ncbi:MAG TPA: hypothetical protein VF126_06270 [Acidobacteriaceae bacterium]|jgi:hypothetical protein
MADQGNLFSTRDESATAVQAPPEPPPRQIPRWLLMMETILFVVLRLYVGALVVLLPWRSIWTTNAWVNHWPDVANFIAQGWVRGIVSGLGLLNIWIAFSAIIHRRRS